MIKLKENIGITLVALIITVIILLILAGVALSLVIGENGLITKSKQGVSKYKEKEETEKAQLEEFEAGGDEFSEDKKVMKILVNSGEDGKVVLPVVYESGELEIKWGDNDKNQTGQIIEDSKKIASVGKVRLSEKNTIFLPTHQYQEKNKEYEIELKGKIVQIYSWSRGETLDKIIKINQWGETGIKYIALSKCTNLKEIANPTYKSFEKLAYISFSECTNLTSIPENLFENCPNLTCLYATFKNCSNIKKIPQNLFKNCTNVEIFAETFANCTGLTSIPENLFENCGKVKSFSGTFYNCTNLNGNPLKLWNEGRENIDSESGGDACYYNCTGLTDYSNIPEKWTQEILQIQDEVLPPFPPYSQGTRPTRPPK